MEYLGPKEPDLRAIPEKIWKKTSLYCGPTVLCAITRADGDTIKTLIRQQTGRTRITGTCAGELRMVLKRLAGYRMFMVLSFEKDEAKPTLAAWLRSRTADQRKRCYIINITGHWVAVQGNRFLDSKTDGKTVPTGEAPGRRKRVHAVYMIAGRG